MSEVENRTENSSTGASSGRVGIDWELFASDYVKIEDGNTVELVLSNWKQTQKLIEGENRDGIYFDVTQEDGKDVKKKLDTTSKTLINALKPLVQNAEKEGRTEFKCRITRTGLNKNTRYAVKELKL